MQDCATAKHLASGRSVFRGLVYIGIGISVSLASLGHAQEAALFSLREISTPVASDAREPSLTTLGNDRVVMSWTEDRGAYAAVRMAVLEGSEWSPIRTIHHSQTMFVNWADFPSVVVLSDGTLAAHWLELNGPGSYQYDVNISFSSDEGRSWTVPILPHDDRSQREHGFVSLVPDSNGGLTALWLDGRAYDGQAEDDSFANAMQIRARRMTPDGTMGPESLLDVRACTCCQTSAVHTDAGDIVAVYRDRTAEEIRDISVIRMSGGVWGKPANVHADGWEITGCPVNGPAVDALGMDVAVIWFTAPNGDPNVKIAFSNDGGAQFDAPLILDLGAPGGRVDVLQLSDGTALALWMEYAKDGEAIIMCRVSQESGCTTPMTLHVNLGRESVGFPRMARKAGGAYVAWTGSAKGSAGGTTIRFVEVAIAP